MPVASSAFINLVKARNMHYAKPTVQYVLASALLVALCGCAPKAQFHPTATIQDIMQSIIDPNIDAVWNSVATISTIDGTVEKSPHTDAEWKEVRQHALVVAEAGNLLIMAGRTVAQPGAVTSTHAVELSPAEVQKGIDGHRDAFNGYALALRDASVVALTAINEKNTEKLVEAGGKIDRVCESCHAQFWYPNDKPPK